MSSSYKTIRGESQAVFREKMSKFISFACHVRTEEEAKSFIERIRNEYHDARHVCWAFVLGADRGRSLSNDNGEPSGTAGKPILGQINSFGLTNVVIAVVRYFGGIKLGTSGLIVAYREAARLALEEAEVIEKTEEVALTITFGYLSMDGVMRLIKTENYRVLSQDFDNTCIIVIAVPRRDSEDIALRFSGLDGVCTTVSPELLAD